MPGEVGNGSGMLGHPLFAAHYNIHAGERSSRVSDIQLKMCVIAVWSHTLHTPQNMWHFIVTLKKALIPKKNDCFLESKPRLRLSYARFNAANMSRIVRWTFCYFTVCLHKQISSCLVLWKLPTVLCWIQLTEQSLSLPGPMLAIAVNVTSVGASRTATT